MSALKQPAPADDVANVAVKQAAIRLGVSERRVRNLVRDGRILAAMKAGAEWLIPTPVQVISGRRGPVSVAGRADVADRQRRLTALTQRRLGQVDPD